MEIHISDFNTIKSASVKLSGLTVIAGENDTGKSTVGKLIFAIVKAMRKYSQDFDVVKEQKLEREVEKLYITARKLFAKEKNIEVVHTHFFPPRFLAQLEPFISNS